MQIAPIPTTIPQLARAGAELGRLAKLTAPGLEVAPVVEALAAVRDAIDGARPQLEERGASQWLLGELARVRGGAATLADSLTQLATQDGMQRFDAAFAADDASWDGTFAEYAQVVATAQQVAAART